MRFLMTAALLAATSLGACAQGSQGNPDHQPYANEEGGVIATKPQVMGTESYDPYGTPAPFADMASGSIATTPAPQPPMNLSPQATPRPRR